MGQMDGGDGGGGHPYHYQALLAAVHQQTVPFPNPFPAPSSGTEAIHPHNHNHNQNNNHNHNAAPHPCHTPTPRGFADWSASTSAFTSLAAHSSTAPTNAVHYSFSPCYAFWTPYMLNKNAYPSFPAPHDDHLRLANNHHPRDAPGPASSYGVESFTSVSMEPNICTNMPPIGGPISAKEDKKPEILPRVIKSSDELEITNSNVELSCETFGTLPQLKQGHESRATKLLNSGEYQVILRKELTKSDVGNVGRIVLPKKDAEASLPPLLQRDPVILHMDDMVLPVTWKFKYRYWPNNKSRMYILDSAGEFLKTHGLQAGDVIIIYKNMAPGKFIIRGEKAIHQQTTNP
uniref:Iron deficiency-responsive cis-acting element-binding factor 1 n=1 Tax=Oryza coarctata TaxID=77588 RepID=H2DJW2_ORYCO|nr:iron deficiency-responsive cis-acting element-binding factor 1 [Oryza coarctata]AEX88465.1 iron deficiency-responsive cis-acting element-binding factor 1 [Oryza coarctata]